MTDSILESIKEKVGIKSPDITAFDSEIIMDINMAFSFLTRIGVGPETGYRIEDENNTWDEFIGEIDPRLEAVKEYVALQVKIIFDSSTMSSAMVEIYKDHIHELEWTLTTIVDPDPLKKEDV